MIDEDSYEMKEFKHSTEFYLPMNNLARQKYIKVIASKGDPNNVGYVVQVEYNEIEEIANAIGIHLYEFLYYGGMRGMD